MRKQLFRAILFIFFLAWSISVRVWPVVILILALGALQIYLNLFPRSRLVPILGYWIGPFPRVGEKQSSYLYRLSLFAFVILLLLVGVVFMASYLFPDHTRALERHPIFAGIFTFAIPIFCGTAALGCLLCAIKATWLRVRGKDPIFAGSNEGDT